MLTRTEHFWNRPFSKKAALTFTVTAGVGLILFQGWLGRKRLFVANDRQYQASFALFAIGTAILLGALMVIGAWARTAKYQDNFTALQVSMGALSFLAIALISVFGNYTSSNLNVGSVSESIVMAAVFAVWNAMTMKRSVR